MFLLKKVIQMYGQGPIDYINGSCPHYRNVSSIADEILHLDLVSATFSAVEFISHPLGILGVVTRFLSFL